MRNSHSSTSGTQAAVPAPSAATVAKPAANAVPHPDASLRPLHRADLAVRWRDLDAFEHVNNSGYLTYLEEARLQWLGTLPGPWMSETTAPVLAASHLNYRQPIGWPERLIVELFVERLGNTSLTLAHRMVSARDASIAYSDGNVVLVWIDRASGRPAALPETVRTACASTG